jgi:hypothetical protein
MGSSVVVCFGHLLVSFDILQALRSDAPLAVKLVGFLVSARGQRAPCGERGTAP